VPFVGYVNGFWHQITNSIWIFHDDFELGRGLSVILENHLFSEMDHEQVVHFRQAIFIFRPTKQKNVKNGGFYS